MSGQEMRLIHFKSLKHNLPPHSQQQSESHQCKASRVQDCVSCYTRQDPQNERLFCLTVLVGQIGRSADMRYMRSGTVE